MSKPRVTDRPWYARGREVLADGYWHDGRHVMNEMMKVITPGLAARHAEEERQRVNGNDGDRVRQVDMTELIQIGKRRLVAQVVSARVRAGTWQTDPAWPFGGVWDVRGWQLRSVESGFLSLNDIALRLGVTESKIRTFFRHNPDLPHEVFGTGSRAFVRVARSDFETWDLRAREWLAGERERASDASRRAMATRQARPRNLFTPTVVAAVESVLGPGDGVPVPERLSALQARAERVDVLEVEVASMRLALGAIQSAAERADPVWWESLQRHFAEHDIMLTWPERPLSHS
jgi:hypothetical protein